MAKNLEFNRVNIARYRDMLRHPMDSERRAIVKQLLRWAEDDLGVALSGTTAEQPDPSRRPVFVRGPKRPLPPNWAFHAKRV